MGPLLPFAFDFMQRAFLVTVIVALPMALLSCFLVLRGWSLMGDAISHAVLPGIVVAYWFGAPLALGAFAAGMLCAGATGYLVKETPPAEVLAAIREVHEGGAPMSSSIARQVVGAFRRPGAARGELSAREREVLEGLVAGKTNRQIADALFVSPNTIGFHVKQIYTKLQVRSRAEAVARVAGPWRAR